MKTLVGIPCYNCKKQIGRVLDSLEKEELHLKIDLFIFVDNGSQDGTVEELLSLRSKSYLKEKILILKNENNYGLGGTHKVIFEYAFKENFEWVVLLHGDEQANVKDIHALLKIAYEKKHTILGSRFMEESILIGYQKKRIIGNKVLNFVFSLMTKKKILDLGSGLNIFKVEDLKKISFENISNDFNFNSELLLNLFSESSLTFAPITWRESDQQSNARNLNVAMSMLKSLFLWKLGKVKNNESDVKYTYEIM
jgi:dolichol-phosphate mannosyltransferase